ncbi:MFS Git1p-related glycerophosphoinositol and glycerophosphocholine permease [Auricularia subglabra TFB-10046 SS5]|uniref:MFS Git1p-related glycerophosphoinositol and glycerophosphocholine permease n=1 Tax=Auricularia subglabra (strain TFB-10046 / SS5) TaxID=717982 RepID=J0D737_AURST|nr:MFS Git1p-related glycerophosphoinositol and glycerophosphocholine permease [Auricularia subglabra TFB-10046 SS5]
MTDVEQNKKVPLGRISLIFACGTALFSDGYANGVIGSVNTILRRLYPNEIDKHDYSRTLSSLAFAGTVVGMLSFGYLSDRFGRKFGMMTATGIVALFSALSAASAGANGSIGGMLAALSAYRFLLGIGVGAEYPCGSVAASEQSEEEGISKKAQHRWFTLATNSMIDFGFVVSAFVPLVLVWICGTSHLRAVWRLALGLGVIPAMAVFVWRLRMEEPTRYKEGAMRRKVPYWLIIKRYWPGLCAISFTWFLYDFIVYPFGIYSSVIVDRVTNGDKALTTVFGWNVVVNLFYMPGTLVGAFVVDILGPKYTMITGLLFQALFGFVMSGCYSVLSKNIAGFAVLYGIFLSFGEFGACCVVLAALGCALTFCFPSSALDAPLIRRAYVALAADSGPGNCLGLLASKTGPTAVRGQYYGVAAAIGKVGAFVGTWAFPPIIDAFAKRGPDQANTGPFWVGSGLAILSAAVTFFFIVPLTHDGMAEEDRQFREYLAANGYDLSNLGLSEEDSVGGASTDDLPEKEKAEHEAEVRVAPAA